MRPLLRTIARKHWNPRSFWMTRLALALVCWALWYHDLTALAVGIGGALVSLVAFRPATDTTAFSARAVAWQGQVAKSWPHALAYALAALPIGWGLWANNTAWIAVGLLAWLTITWHFAVSRTAPADASDALPPPQEAAPPPASPSHNEMAFPNANTTGDP